MNNNYKHIQRLNDELLREYYQMIEKDLEKIINAPSLLARLSKYYHLVQDTENDMNVLLFVYEGKVWIIREWNVDKFLNHINFKKRVEFWCERGLSVIPPEPVMYMGGLQK